MSPPSTHPDTIDGKAVTNLVKTQALRGATILGQPGGWAVVVRYGAMERVVAAQRTHRMRLWRNLNTAAAFVRDELGMDRFEVDAVDYDPRVNIRHRPDAAARLKRALSYDDWARRDLEAAVREADDPATEWIAHDEAMAEIQAVLSGTAPE